MFWMFLSKTIGVLAGFTSHIFRVKHLLECPSVVSTFEVKELTFIWHYVLAWPCPPTITNKIVYFSRMESLAQGCRVVAAGNVLSASLPPLRTRLTNHSHHIGLSTRTQSHDS